MTAPLLEADDEAIATPLLCRVLLHGERCPQQADWMACVTCLSCGARRVPLCNDHAIPVDLDGGHAGFVCMFDFARIFIDSLLWIRS